MAACGPEIWDRAIRAGINLAMEASVCGGIPIHAVLREGISGDRVQALYGILNGTCNYILTEMEKRGASLETMLAEAQRLGYAEADPSADVDGFDARSQAGAAGGAGVRREDHAVGYLRGRHPPHHAAGFPVRAGSWGTPSGWSAAARKTPDGLILFVRPALIPTSTILAGVQGAYNAVWVKGMFGEDTFYYGWGAGASDGRGGGERPDARGARDSQRQSGARLAVRARAAGREQAGLGDSCRSARTTCASAWTTGRASSPSWPGILAEQAHQPGSGAAGALRHQARPAVRDHRRSRPREQSIREAVEEMSQLDFMREAPLALPMETAL